MSPLKSEIKQARAFGSLEEEAILNVVRTGDQVVIRLTRFLRDHGVTEPQYNVLRILRGAGEPLPCLEVASRMVTVVPAITGLLDRLETAGLVLRARSAEDRRVVFVSISRSGLQLLAKLDEPIAELQRELFGHMTRKDLRELIRLCELARERCIVPQ